VLFLFAVMLSSTVLFSKTADSLEINKFSSRIPYELELKVKVKPSIAIGYANCYNGEVVEVVRGKLADEKILLTVVAGDKSNENIFSKAGDEDILMISFVFNKANEPYSTTYVTGFVDSEKNSWRIVNIIKP